MLRRDNQWSKLDLDSDAIHRCRRRREPGVRSSDTLHLRNSVGTIGKESNFYSECLLLKIDHIAYTMKDRMNQP